MNRDKDTLKQKIKRDAELRLNIEDLVELNERYSTIFLGLKLNTPHNSAIIENFTFMIRRLIYAALIVFMPHLPQIATMTLLIVCLIVLIFNLTEKPWTAPEMNKLAFANEALLYVLIVLIIASPSLSTEAGHEVLGWFIIGVVTLVIHINLTAMLVEAWHHCRLLYARYQNKKSFLAKFNSKVMPRQDSVKHEQEVPSPIAEVSSLKEEDSS